MTYTWRCLCSGQSIGSFEKWFFEQCYSPLSTYLVVAAYNTPERNTVFTVNTVSVQTQLQVEGIAD